MSTRHWANGRQHRPQSPDYRDDRTALTRRLRTPTAVGHTDAWTDFRKDHELLERLKVTADELEALDRCVLLGTLASKQDLLFILRQIREATGAPSEQPGEDAVPTSPRRADSANSPRRGSETAAGSSVAETPMFGATSAILQHKSTELALLLISAVVSATALIWALLTGLNALSEQVFTTAGVSLVDAPIVPGLGSLGFEGGVRTLVAAEIVFVAVFVLVYGYDRWTAIRRLRSYRQRNSAASRR